MVAFSDFRGGEITHGNNNKNNGITFRETEAICNSECAVKIVEIQPDNVCGYTLKVKLQNKSDCKSYMFVIEDASVNGVQCSDFLFAKELCAGEISDEKIIFSDNSFKDNGISDYTDVELAFRVYNNNDWTEKSIAEETVRIYPYGEDKAVKFVRIPQASDNVIIDNEYVTVVVTSCDKSSSTMDMFFMNKTNKNLEFRLYDIPVNGHKYTEYPFYVKYIFAGKCGFATLPLMDAESDNSVIDGVCKKEFNIQVYDNDNCLEKSLINKNLVLDI